MPSTRYDILALGNAIVDVIAQTPTDFIATHKLTKGAMTLIDEGAGRDPLRRDGRHADGLRRLGRQHRDRRRELRLHRLLRRQGQERRAG